MRSKTNEQALESAIQKALTGKTSEDLKSQGISIEETNEAYLAGAGYFIGNPNNFDAKYAIDLHHFWQFLEETQEEELEKIQRHSDWKLRILERFDRLVKRHGILRLLKKGIGVEDAHFTLFYQPPMASSSKEVKDNYTKNHFSVSRQIRYNTENQREEIDMVIFLNGIPLVTIELKNPWTGQNARVHGIRQYQFDRDYRQPLLQFARCIVHFAVDTEEVYMCTKLIGKDSYFLPFNKGNNHGKGNPVNEGGHKTAYLWEEVLSKDSLANIIHHFVLLEGSPTEALNKRKLIFPRYHQMDVVQKLLADISERGVGETYLIQHSAGSGKSNSITWLAYQLIEVYPNRENIPGFKSLEDPLFDTVIVVTDRRLLDRQLRDNIREFSQVKNIVAHAESSRDLRTSLEQGKRIVITTIQKFPFIVDGIKDLSDKRFAVIIDEAHSSQGGIASATMNQAMGMEDEEDGQDKILRALKARKQKDNASYFAFTATPKNATFERFGVKQEDGSFREFHLYSMKQAIEEGFILDVLANYTTYRSYYEIEKSIQENPLFDSRKAQKKLRAYVERHEQTIATKADIMLEHFIGKIYNTKKLKGQAKAMVVTQSIETTIRYYFALKRILEEKGNPFEILIAFSGKKMVDGIEYTEAELNGFPESKTREKFEEDNYRILVVANKYLTGFDEPRLCTMYVDKKLQGVLAVQALSRLNRAAHHLGKKTEDLFVLDFFNSVDDIKQAFDAFYTSTSLSEATDINVLHDLKEALDITGIYEWDEVEDFVEKYFDGLDAQYLSPIIDKAAHRYNEEFNLEQEEKADIKIKAKQFVKIYGQIAAIIDFEILEWEKLFWFLKFLIPKLLVKDDQADAMDNILESVDLSTYGLERTKLNFGIQLDDSESELTPQNPNPRGAHASEEEKDPLDDIIRNFNERWHQGWDATPEVQRMVFITLAKTLQAHPDFQMKVADNPDIQNSDLAFEKMVQEIMTLRRRQDMELYKSFITDEGFQKSFLQTLKRVTTGINN